MRTSSATEEVIAAIHEERRRQSAVLEPNNCDCDSFHDRWTNAIYHERRCSSLGAVPEPILSNEVNIPHINVITIACIAFACEVCLVIGFYIGWAVGQ